MFAHGRLKLQTRDQLQNLTENTAYSVHGGISVRWYWFSTINPTYRRFHLAALAAQSLTLGGSHLIWTRVVWGQAEIQICAAPLNQNLQQHNIRSNSRAYLDTVFDRYCENSGEVRSSGTSIGISIPDIPVSLTGSAEDSAQKTRSFCKTYRSTRTEHSDERDESFTTARSAFKSFDDCIHLLGNSITIVPTIRSREAVDFYIAGGRRKSVQLAGITYPHKTITCTGQ